MNGAPASTWDNLFYPPVCNFPGDPQDPQKYTYFRQPLSAANARAWMADTAVLCYGRSRKVLMDPVKFGAILAAAGFSDFDLIGDWPSATGTLGYFARRSDFAVLSFRGTQKGDWGDSLTDIDTVPIDPGDSGGALVHQGFWDALDSVWPRAKSLLDSYRAGHPLGRIYFTGHSLGAALATLALWRFQKDSLDGNVALYTIGCPRAGNRKFCVELTDRATQGNFRTMDGNDFVTHVPMESLGFDHPGGGLHIGPRPWQDSFETLTVLKDADEAAFDELVGRNPPEDLADHSPVRYQYYLWL